MIDICSLWLIIVFSLQNEVESLSKIQHQNIVSLLGYCIHGEARFLVYEMMENGSLELHLHGNLCFSEVCFSM